MKIFIVVTRPVILCAALLVIGCMGTSPASPVTTEAQAIRVAKERCSTIRPFDPGERWHANLHDGQWHVWLTRDLDPREPVVGTLDIWIRAHDGVAGNCNHSN